MKVTIRREEETWRVGVFKKIPVWVSWVKVELTAGEKETIEAAGIGDLIWFNHPFFRDGSDDAWPVRFIASYSDKGEEMKFVAGNAPERNEIEEKIKEGLAAVKSQIEAQMSRGESETFEL
jgi:hypothetical protein